MKALKVVPWLIIGSFVVLVLWYYSSSSRPARDDGGDVALAVPEMQAPVRYQPAVQREVYRTTATDLQADFDFNEVAADAKMRGKQILVIGVVEAIELDFMDDVVVRLKTGGYKPGAMMNMTKTERDQAAKLKRGQRVELLCDSAKRMATIPMVQGCVFTI